MARAVYSRHWEHGNWLSTFHCVLPFRYHYILHAIHLGIHYLNLKVRLESAQVSIFRADIVPIIPGQAEVALLWRAL